MTKAQENKIRETIHNGYTLKPDKLICSKLNWKYGIRAVLRGENLMLTGATGCGKDLFVHSLAEALNRESYYIPFGATQDPRSSIIGNTHFDKNKGTFMQLSYFAQAIQKKNAVIILDELTRAHPEVQNLLMTVLDRDKRWLRIDEDPETPMIHVAEGVCFLATANIGAEYLTTRGLDRAFLDRWSILELPYLIYEQENENLKRTYPDLSDTDRELLVAVVIATRTELQKDIPTIDTALSTRAAEEMAALVIDGFTVSEAIKVKAFPLYSTDGNPSPRQSFTQLIQGFMPDLNPNAEMENLIQNNGDGPKF